MSITKSRYFRSLSLFFSIFYFILFYIISFFLFDYFSKGNDLTDDIIPDLARYLKETPTIQSISLDDSEFTIDGCRKLSQTLQTLPNLQTLSITTSQLTAGSVLLLAK